MFLVAFVYLRQHEIEIHFHISLFFSSFICRFCVMKCICFAHCRPSYVANVDYSSSLFVDCELAHTHKDQVKNTHNTQTQTENWSQTNLYDVLQYG